MKRSCLECVCHPVCIINQVNDEHLFKFNFAPYSDFKEKLACACRFFIEKDEKPTIQFTRNSDTTCRGG